MGQVVQFWFAGTSVSLGPLSYAPHLDVGSILVQIQLTMITKRSCR